MLESFPNPALRGDYEVELNVSHFITICPVTEAFDVGVLGVLYVPGHVCLEGFYFSAYLKKFSEKPMYHEEIVQTIFDDLGTCLNPKRLKVVCKFPLYSKLGGEPLHITVRRES